MRHHLVRGGGQAPESGVLPIRVRAPLEIVEPREAGGTPCWDEAPGELLAIGGRKAALRYGIEFRVIAGQGRGMGTPPLGDRAE